MKLNLTPPPALQELCDDLENQICNKTLELAMIEAENAPRYLCYGLEMEIKTLNEVLVRVEAQQDLINQKAQLIHLN